MVDDSDRIEAIRAGDRGAFDALAREYYERLIRFAFIYVRSRTAAEDIVHDVLFAFWRNRETLKVRYSVRSYLFGAVRNRAFNHRRQTSAQEQREQQLASRHDIPGVTRVAIPPDVVTNEAERLVAERDAIIQKVVEELPPRQKEALTLRIQLGLSYAEVAEVMGISSRTAEGTYFRAIQFLRQRLVNLIP